MIISAMNAIEATRHRQMLEDLRACNAVIWRYGIFGFGDI